MKNLSIISMAHFISTKMLILNIKAQETKKCPEVVLKFTQN